MCVCMCVCFGVYIWRCLDEFRAFELTARHRNRPSRNSVVFIAQSQNNCTNGPVDWEEEKKEEVGGEVVGDIEGQQKEKQEEKQEAKQKEKQKKQKQKTQVDKQKEKQEREV